MSITSPFNVSEDDSIVKTKRSVNLIHKNTTYRNSVELCVTSDVSFYRAPVILWSHFVSFISAEISAVTIIIRSFVKAKYLNILRAQLFALRAFIPKRPLCVTDTWVVIWTPQIFLSPANGLNYATLRSGISNLLSAFYKADISHRRVYLRNCFSLIVSINITNRLIFATKRHCTSLQFKKLLKLSNYLRSLMGWSGSALEYARRNCFKYLNLRSSFNNM